MFIQLLSFRFKQRIKNAQQIFSSKTKNKEEQFERNVPRNVTTDRPIEYKSQSLSTALV